MMNGQSNMPPGHHSYPHPNGSMEPSPMSRYIRYGKLNDYYGVL